MVFGCEEALLASNVQISEDFIARSPSVMKSLKQWVTADYKHVKGILNNLIKCASNVSGL
jgi:hypothetical protein